MRSILQLRKMRDIESEISSWSPPSPSFIRTSSPYPFWIVLLGGQILRGSELQQERLGSERVKPQLEQTPKSRVQPPKGCDSFPSHPAAVTSKDPSVVAA